MSRTLEEQAELWRATRAGLAENTRVSDASTLNVWILPFNPEDGDGPLGKRRVAEALPEHLEAILAKVTAAGRSGSLRQRVYTTWNLLMDHAVTHGVIESHAGRRVVCGTPRRVRRPQPFTPQDVDQLLERGGLDEADRLYVRTLATLGLRPQEATALTAGQFNWDDGRHGSVYIDRAAKSDLTVGHTKNEQERTLPLPTSVAGPLREWIDRHGITAGDLLWPPGRPGNRPRSSDAWTRRRWRPAVDAAGLEGRNPYDLRHTCASRLIAAGASPVDVAEWMGHTKEVCLRVYAHLFPGRKHELAELLDRS